MSTHQLAGHKVPEELIPNIPNLVSLYFTNKPDIEDETQKVNFGTSGHRGTSLNSSFTESHILAITQAICDYRKANNISGPIFLGKDTHALSNPAEMTAIEVLAANEMYVNIAQDDFTPTPVISHAILTFNQSRQAALADGIIITPSHNPPTDGGFKYNPTSGGPAGSDITTVIANKANEYLQNNLTGVKRMAFAQAVKSEFIQRYDYMTPYIDDLENILDMQAISNSGLKICADALGGAGIKFWPRIAEKYNFALDTRNTAFDPTFQFMRVDWDGKIRMDCSSPFAMSGLVELKEKYDLAFGNDPDYDRHGIVAPSAGLLNPNHYLAVAIAYLFQNRKNWNANAAVGKTLVSSSIIDRVVADIDKKLHQVPVGFKWFVNGLLDGSLGFGGEESAGASFLRKNGTVWSTDKDGIIMCLLAAEMLAKTGKDAGEQYALLTDKFGAPVYQRKDAPANLEQKDKLQKLSAEQVTAKELAGEKIINKLTHAPGNNAAIGGLKVVTKNGWFAARPSGTESIYKIYAESFLGEDHLDDILTQAQNIVDKAVQ